MTSLAMLSRADRARWQFLASHRPESAPLVDEAWVTAWTEAFGPREPILLTACDESGLVGLASLHLVRQWTLGWRIATLHSLTNEESFRFDFLASPGREDVVEQLWRALCGTESWDVIRLDHVPEGSPTLEAGMRVARELGWRPVLERTFVTPWRVLANGGDWDHGLTRKFKSNLRNRERRLAALGEVSFDVPHDQETLERRLTVFYTLEAGGWKGASGTALALRPDARRFYDALVRRAGDRIIIPVLAVGGKPVAAQVLFVQGGTMYMLKTAYDQRFAELAPGQLITARVMRYGRDHGLETLDFLADDATWKADWAPCYRAHYRLHVFAPTAGGRYAYWSRHGVREGAKRVPGAVQFARWLRAQRS